MIEFKNKKLLITGGTGSFGNAVCMRLMDAGLSEIRIFSRDEKKQDDMRKRLNNTSIKFYDPDDPDTIDSCYLISIICGGCAYKERVRY